MRVSASSRVSWMPGRQPEQREGHAMNASHGHIRIRASAKAAAVTTAR
jgi:hypothetical protein